MATLDIPELDRTELLHELAELIAARGYERFVSWPIVEPTRKFLPDTWKPEPEAVAVLLRRLMTYANIDIAAELTSFDRNVSEDHPNAPAWFAGIEDGVCKFGIDIHEIKDPQSLIACLCHEIAHAYRALHLLADEQRDVEEKLTDLTCVYLGFGIFVVNASELYRKSGYQSGMYAVTKWSSGSIGYLDVETLSFLFAAQLAARGGRARDFVRHLETNQAGYVESYVKVLAADRDGLLEELGIPPEESWPEAPDASQFTGPIDETTLDVHVVEHESVAAPQRRDNEGRPVFRVRERRFAVLAYVGIVAGLVAGLIATAIWDNGMLIVAGGVAGLLVAVIKGWGGVDYCSGPHCRSRLAPEAATCENCGGIIRGRIRSYREHLEAEEALEAER